MKNLLKTIAAVSAFAFLAASPAFAAVDLTAITAAGTDAIAGVNTTGNMLIGVVAVVLVFGIVIGMVRRKGG